MRLKLTRAQIHTLHRLFGASRYVWNWALELRTTVYRERNEKLNWVALSAVFTQYRKAPGTEWLSSLPREPFNQVLRDQEKAFGNFFAKRAQYPRFRRRGQHDAVRFTLDQRREQVDRAAGTVSLPGFGTVRFKNTYGEMPGRLRSVTFSKDAAGRYHASFTADHVPAPARTAPLEAAVGIDMGLEHLVTLSAGEVVAAPKALAKHLHKLTRYQRRMARQRNAAMIKAGLDPTKPLPTGTRLLVSNRQRRTQRRIGRLHARVADIRMDTTHQLTAGLVRRFKVFAFENLNVKAMVRSMGRRAFRRAVADASLGELRRQLEYKAAWQGRTVIWVDRFYPSSKTCSRCGTVNGELTLSDRRWTCPGCGIEHDRDHNAAINIKREGLRLLAQQHATPGSGESAAGVTPGPNARGEISVREWALACSTRPDSTNREPVKRRSAPSSRLRRQQRRRTGT